MIGISRIWISSFFGTLWCASSVSHVNALEISSGWISRVTTTSSKSRLSNDICRRTHSRSRPTSSKASFEGNSISNGIWNHHSENEDTWELEEDMRRLYPQLFQKGTFRCLKIRGRIFLKGRIVRPSYLWDCIWFLNLKCKW